MEDTKKNVTLMIIGALALLVTVVGAAYAYFTAQTGTSTGTDVEATTNTTDSLTFDTGEDISIYATLDNFGEGKGSPSSTATASATLLANNKTNTATMNYYLYLNILENNLEYTTADKKAELLMTVISPTGEITSLEGLDYVTYNEGTDGTERIAGFDITEIQDAITLAYNYEIKVEESNAEHSKTDNWQVKITLVNLDENQNANLQKVFNANLMIRGNAIYNLAYYIKSTAATDSTLILHNGTITDTTETNYGVIDAEDNNYRYSGASDEVNNFVCFGSDAEICPNDNLYRIIGVFGNQVKLIKYDYALTNLLGTDGEYKGVYSSSTSYYKGPTDVAIMPRYYFNSLNGDSSTNDWTISRLNTINLNTNYVKNIGSKWMEKIADTTWKIGGMTWAQGSASPNIVKNAYKYELGANSINKTYPAKIGLIYMSDYYYAASPTYWTYYGYKDNDETKDYRAARDNNWMYMGLSEWSITPRTDASSREFGVDDTGGGGGSSVYTSVLGVRPSFYLKSSTMLSGGSGSMKDPYRILV